MKLILSAIMQSLDKRFPSNSRTRTAGNKLLRLLGGWGILGNGSRENTLIISENGETRSYNS